MASKTRKRRERKLLPPIVYNVGIQQEYARAIRRLIKPMVKEATEAAIEAYRQYMDGQLVAADAFDYDDIRLKQIVDVLRNRFNKYVSKWDSAEVDELAASFTGKLGKRSRNTLMTRLKKAGIVIDFKISPLYLSTLEQATITNVNLIRSIPKQYFDKLTNVVMDSAKKGRDMGSIYRHIRDLNEVTTRKAELIAIDQTNKATQALNLIEAKDIGIAKGIWVHIPGEKSSRETHIEMDGKKFDLDKGLYDEDVGQDVLPGELPYCRCTFRYDVSELLANEQDKT